MEQSKNPRRDEQTESEGDQVYPDRPEAVFVLRLRAGDVGWRGQVHRLDVKSLRYVAGQLELTDLLENDWLQAVSQDESKSKEREDGKS